MTVEILELTGDNRPAKAAFTFAVPLEDPSLRWMQYKDGSFISFTPPAIGESVVLQAEKLFWN
jgi:phage baseplate assembly protein gpV